MTAFRTVLADGSLQGQRVWVTGAGSGIGRAIALRLAQLGAVVGGCGRREDALAETGAMVRQAGGRFEGAVCDIRDTARAADVLNAFASDGGLTALVNNAGGQFHARAHDISANGFASVIDLNLNALFAMTRAAYTWLGREGGAVVNLSIAPVDRGALGLAHSVAARSGVSGLTRALALEWGEDAIRVNCIAPGAVETPAFLAKSSKAGVHALAAASPLRSNALPEEVAELTAFLVSPAGRLITGQVLRIDGGLFLAAPLDLRPSAAPRTLAHAA